jgi:hypothetical protein
MPYLASSEGKTGCYLEAPDVEPSVGDGGGIPMVDWTRRGEEEGW